VGRRTEIRPNREWRSTETRSFFTLGGKRTVRHRLASKTAGSGFTRGGTSVAAGARHALACLLLAAASATVAQPPEDTLARIAETGVVNLGHRESSVPFSYYDQRRQVVGFSHELMLRAVDALRAELKLPALTVRLVPVTPQNRIPLVQNGSVDLECASTSHNVEREKQVAFSVSFFLVGTRLMVRRGSPVHGFDDLGGRRVVTTSGTTSDRLLRLHNERTGGRIDIVLARDHGEAFQALEQGRADAFMMDDALLYGERAKAQRPDDWVVVGEPMSSEPYACMMRRGDARFKAAVDAALVGLMKSGEVLRLHDRWFRQPIPPKGLNLAWPASEALLELYRSPTDRVLQ
jgi:glutamate/aspartate transport system substrate-binding protein